MLKKLFRTKSESVEKMNRRELKTTTRNEILKMCRKCYSFGYDGGWHFERPKFLQERDMDEKISVQFSQCPACVEETLAMYDAEYA